MSDTKPWAIGLFIVALLLLGVMIWKYMVPHAPPVGANEPYVPSARNYGAPPGGQAPAPPR